MKILAIDVGTGTEDILLYDSEKEIENSMKLVIPSPHLTIGQMISECESDIYFDGVIMGGGKIKDRCLEHMEKGYKIAFEDLAARTIRGVAPRCGRRWCRSLRNFLRSSVCQRR